MDTVALTSSPAAWYSRLAPEMRLAMLLLITGLAIAGWGVWGNLVAAETSGWNSTDGVCERIDITPVPMARGRYDIKAKYTYEMPGGRMAIGTNMTRLGAVRVHSEEQKESYENQYRFGKTVSVRFNPKDPRMAVIETGTASVAPITGPAIRWGGILAVIGLLLLTMELNRQGKLT